MISNEEIVGMIEWEGGLFDLLEHGISTKDIADNEVANAFHALIKAKSDFDFLAGSLQGILWAKGV